MIKAFLFHYSEKKKNIRFYLGDIIAFNELVSLESVVVTRTDSKKSYR